MLINPRMGRNKKEKKKKSNKIKSPIYNDKLMQQNKGFKITDDDVEE